MKTTPLPEILKAANLGNLYADLAHSIINPPPVGLEPQGRDLVATVFDFNLGRERAAATAAYITHAANVLPELLASLRELVEFATDDRGGDLPITDPMIKRARQALSIATNVPVNS